MDTIPFNSISIILRSLDFAAKRHRSQFRKGEEKTPFVNHPIQVANLLANEGGEADPVLLSAAVLHDVIEDTVETVEDRNDLITEIREIFGDEILSLTLEVTDDKTLVKEERKRMQIEHGPGRSDRAKKLKIADKITNIRDLMYYPPAGWQRSRIIAYFDWSEQVVAGLRGVNAKLDNLFDAELRNARSMYRADS